jgi:type I restriction-modification system DNA methylase subunit
MLTVAQNRLLELAKKHGKEVAIHLFGQEINPETYDKVRRHFIWQRKKMR